MNIKKEIDHLPVDAVAAVEFVSEEIASWDGILVENGVENRMEFWFGDHCLGYILNPPGEVAVANLELPGDLLDDLIASGCARLTKTDHHSSSGSVSVPMETVSEVALAIDLLQYCYCYKRAIDKSGN